MKKRLLCLLTALCLLLTLCACGAADTHTLRVWCFSAGKADAILLWTEGSAVLIDTGEDGFGGTITDKLTELGIDRLDVLILTHFDQDHVGGAAEVLESVAVERVLQSDCPRDSGEYAAYLQALSAAGLAAETLRETLNFSLDGAEYTVWPPEKTDYDEDASNNSSLITAVTYGERRFLFTGDAEGARLREFLDQDAGTFDLLKVPYHGHWQKRLTALLESVRPAYAVITSSDAEPEDARTLSALSDIGAAVFLTREGPVLAECDGQTLTVRCVSG